MCFHWGGWKDRKIEERDKEYKKRMAQQKRNVKKQNFSLKDYVLLKHKKINKWTTAFEPAFYTITKIQGSSITSATERLYPFIKKRDKLQTHIVLLSEKLINNNNPL